MNFQNFGPMAQSLTPLKLFTTNFLETLKLRILILILNCRAGQDELMVQSAFEICTLEYA